MYDHTQMAKFFFFFLRESAGTRRVSVMLMRNEP